MGVLRDTCEALGLPYRLFGFDSAVINGAVDAIRGEFGLDATRIGFAVSVALLGAALGAWYAGPVADRWGRVRTMQVAAVALTVWAVRRYRNRNQSSPSQSRRARGSSMPAMLAAGTAWGIAALTDPTFYATAALAGQSRGIVVPAVLVMVWFLISQLPLLAVTVTYLINSEGPAVTRLVALTKRLSMALSHVLTALLAFAALLLAASSATYLGTGLFLPL